MHGFGSPRLIATLGPSSFGIAPALVKSGATELRLNASHMSPTEVYDRCRALRLQLPDIPIVVDLQGKKMRIGEMPVRLLEKDTRIVLSSNGGDPDSVFVPHPELFELVVPGEHLSLDDGRIELLIVEREPNRLIATVIRPGPLHSRKGLNRIEHPLEPSSLTAWDQQTVVRCATIPAIEFAVSFASSGEEAGWIRSLASNCRAILKVERREALDHFSELAKNADELWVCRGDLGAQLGLYEMAQAVSRLEPAQVEIPVLMAGQVLEHLTSHELPTRSEVCHLHDLLARGYSGIVLSDETAVGADPANAVQWASNLLREFASSNALA